MSSHTETIKESATKLPIPTYNKVVDRLTGLLGDSRYRVLVLSGDWGIGKTYLWNEKLKPGLDSSLSAQDSQTTTATPQDKLLAPIYVSAFSVKNIAELKQKVLLAILRVQEGAGLKRWLVFYGDS